MLPLDAVATIASAPGVARTAEGRARRDGRRRRGREFGRGAATARSRALGVRGVAPRSSACGPRSSSSKGGCSRRACARRSSAAARRRSSRGSRSATASSCATANGRSSACSRRGDATESGMITDAAYAGVGVPASPSSTASRCGSSRRRPSTRSRRRSRPTRRCPSTYSASPTTSRSRREDLADLFFFVTYVVCSIMAAGALVGALNTMYAAVSSRAVEIATLRAIGFGATGVVVSMLVGSAAARTARRVRRQRDLVAALLRRHDQPRRGTGFARDGRSRSRPRRS